MIKEMKSVICVYYIKLFIINHFLKFRHAKNPYRFYTRSRFFYYDNFDKDESLSIIICDNISIYHNIKFVRICYDIKILLKYLSLYSLNLNSIEISFSILKTWIKKYQNLIILYFDENKYNNFLNLIVHA